MSVASGRHRNRNGAYLLVPRRLSTSFPGRVRFLEDESRDLFARDLAFFYSAFVLEELASGA